jgi:site-specific DNA-cytosine methylase
MSYKAVGAYIFAGGFTLGVRDSFEVNVHLEGDPGYGHKTSIHNLGVDVYHGPQGWQRAVDLGLVGSEEDPIDLLFGNPPCAAWSMAGARGDSWKTDARVDCIRQSFDLFKKVKPRAWVWESVTRAFSAGRDFLDSLSSECNELGYEVNYVLHNAKWHGIPNTRKRFFFVATKNAFSPERHNWSPPESAADVIKRAVNIVPFVGSDDRLLWLFDYCHPGGSFKDTFEEVTPNLEFNHSGRVTGRPSFLYKRMPLSGPGLTFSGAPVGHPTEKRWLSVQECQVMCGFPPDYEFIAKQHVEKLKLMARGVMPPVGAWLGRSIRQTLDLAKPPVLATFVKDFREPNSLLGF